MFLTGTPCALRRSFVADIAAKDATPPPSPWIISTGGRARLSGNSASPSSIAPENETMAAIGLGLQATTCRNDFMQGFCRPVGDP